MSENAMDIVNEVMSAHPNDRFEPCGISKIVIGEDVLGSVAQHVQSLVSQVKDPKVLFVVDSVAILRNGQNSKEFVANSLASHFETHTISLDDGMSELHVSEEMIREVSEIVGNYDALVTLGGGTITDIGKMATAGLKNLPLVSIQSAASVDGFTDDVSVILRNGVKRTVASRWPDIVIADTTLIAQAPIAMNQAGFGEISSMFVAPADWLLANFLGFDPLFSRGPIALLEAVGAGYEEWSPGLSVGNLDSIAALVRALDIRGVATGVAGSTALLSGVEHLFSHMLDMARGAAKEKIGLHGAQVGVGSVIASIVWEEFFEQMDSKSIRKAAFIDKSRYQVLARQAFLQLDLDSGNPGAIADECWRDFEQKIELWNENLVLINSFLDNWTLHSGDLKSLIKPAQSIVNGLVAAGSAVQFGALVPAVDEALGHWALKNSVFMRNRLTVLDVLHFIGRWDDETIEGILEKAHNLAEIALLSRKTGPANDH